MTASSPGRGATRLSALGDDWAPPGIRPLSAEEFALFQELIEKEAGIWLSPVKKSLITGRLFNRLRACGVSSYGAYYRLVGPGGDLAERMRMLDCISTNETRFFREPDHFAFLDTRVLPAWKARERRQRQIRVWCAACSSGEEPYSVAMVLLDHFPPASGWRLSILATDLSTRMLQRARQGIWDLARSADIPRRYLHRYMLRGKGTMHGTMKVGPELRALVRFGRLNLNDSHYPVGGRFDLILCRNVLIYFASPGKQRVVQQLIGHLEADGYLFTGHAENLHSHGDELRPVMPTIYTHASYAAAAHAGAYPGYSSR